MSEELTTANRQGGDPAAIVRTMRPRSTDSPPSSWRTLTSGVRGPVRALTERADAAYYFVQDGGRPGRRSEVLMQRCDNRSFSARRSFLSRLGSGFAAVGAALGAGTATALAQGSSSGGWQPARHAEDEWFDKIPGKHRTFLDAVSAQGVGEALHFASNIF